MVTEDAESTDGFLDDCAFLEDELVFYEASIV